MATNPRIAPLERATNRTWEAWLRFFDGIGAEDLDHRAIALRVHEERDGTVEQVGWWTQSVTVAHEQHIGRRVPGQRSEGTFRTSVSRATPLGMAELATQIGVPTLEANDEARTAWTTVVERFLAGT